MYYINKLALAIVNPVTFGIALFVLALGFVFRGWRFVRHNDSASARKSLKVALVVLIVCAGWFYIWSIGLSQRIMGVACGLDEYQLRGIDELPQCDVIVELGGGMGGDTNVSQYACLTPAASRPWHAARLWKAGKAPIVIAAGLGTRDMDGQLLQDLGVPDSVLFYDDSSRNTEENAIFVQRLINEKLDSSNVHVLLVTSASHMKRAMMIFRVCAPELKCFPVVTDYGSVNWFSPITCKSLVPSIGMLARNLVVWKECLGILGYKLRGF